VALTPLPIPAFFPHPRTMEHNGPTGSGPALSPRPEPPLFTPVHSRPRERHARGMLDALKESVWVVPAVLSMAVTLKQLSEQADEEQTRKGGVANQASPPAAARRYVCVSVCVCVWVYPYVW
jgi:hypothetical protein